MIDQLLSLFWLLDLKSVVSVISDTFTLIAGFVAIGIPISVQIVEKAAQRYKSEYLVKHLSSWYWFTPARLILISLGYIALAFLIKYLLPAGEPIPSNQLEIRILVWFLVFYFISLFCLIGLWYRHLLSTLQKRPEDLLNDLSD